MRAPKHDELEGAMDGLTRQMDRVVLLGEQALRDIKNLREKDIVTLQNSHQKAIGTLTRGQQRLQTELHEHINRSLIDILRQRSKEIAYSVAITTLLGLQFPATREQIKVIIPQVLGGGQ